MSVLTKCFKRFSYLTYKLSHSKCFIYEPYLDLRSKQLLTFHLWKTTKSHELFFQVHNKAFKCSFPFSSSCVGLVGLEVRKRDTSKNLPWQEPKVFHQIGSLLLRTHRGKVSRTSAECCHLWAKGLQEIFISLYYYSVFSKLHTMHIPF